MFVNKYPYTDTQELNLDWCLAELSKLHERIDNFETDILNETKAYVDERYSDFDNRLIQFEGSVNNSISAMENDIVAFKNYVDGEIDNLQDQIDLWENTLEADIAAVNQRTDLRIQQNNEWIVEYLGEELRMLKVINYFTGDEISVQDMFDYLATFHLADSITYNQLAAKNNTYTQLLGYNMTYTQLVNSGNIIIN